MKFRKCDEEAHRHQLVTGDLEIAIAQGSLFAPPPAGLLTGKLHQKALESSAARKQMHKLLGDYFSLGRSQWHVSDVSEDRLNFTKYER